MEDEHEVARMLDEGCPNCSDTHAHHLHVKVKDLAVKANGLHRHLMMAIHGAVLLLIVALMYVEGPRPIDAAFLAVSILTELS